MADIGVFLCHHLRVPLSPTAVINKVGLEVSFTPKPDATSLAGEDVFYKDRNGHKHIHIILSKACKKHLKHLKLQKLNTVGSRNLRPLENRFYLTFLPFYTKLISDLEIVQNLKYFLFVL